MERKQKLLTWVKVVLFLVVALLLLIHFSNRFSTGMSGYKYFFNDFYNAKAEDVDVVYIGASGASWNWNPVIAYRENGVASQLLASELLPADAIPYLVKEASLKSPKLYIIDTLRFVGKTYGEISRVESVVVNMRFSANRLAAAEDMLEHYSTEEKLLKYTTFPFFHSRWDELSKDDFLPADSDFMGYHVRRLEGTEDKPQGIEQLSMTARTPRAELVENLEHVLEECGKLDGQVLFIVSPNDSELGEYLAYFRDAVTEAGFDYLNTCAYVDEMGLGEGDFDKGVHLTVYGAEKYTAWLSAYLRETYGLPDRREETGYQEGARYEQAYEDYKEYVIRNGKMFNQYLGSITDPRYSVFVAAMDEASRGLEADNTAWLQALGLQENLEDAYRSAYIAVVDQGELVLERLGESESTEVLCASGQLKSGVRYYMSSAAYTAGAQACIVVDGVNYAMEKRGLNIVVYDNEKHTVIDSVVFDTHSEKLTAKREMPKISETSLTPEELSYPKPDGTGRYAYGVYELSDPLRVSFDEVRHDGCLDISIDAYKGYKVFLYNKDFIVGFDVIPMIDENDQTLRIAHLVLGDETVEAGYDSVLIVPVKTDYDYYHIGHLIPEEP